MDKTQAKIIFAVLALIGTSGLAARYLTDKEPTTGPEAGSASYRDGSYSATGTYTSPAGQEEVGVTVALKDGVVESATFEGKAAHPVSQKLQGMFNDGFEEQVIGKPIEEISLTVVNGSSLTPQGFMDALEKIKTQARS